MVVQQVLQLQILVDQTFEVITAAADTFTITMASNETGTGMTAAGSASINAYN